MYSNIEEEHHHAQEAVDQDIQEEHPVTQPAVKEEFVQDHASRRRSVSSRSRYNRRRKVLQAGRLRPGSGCFNNIHDWFGTN